MLTLTPHPCFILWREVHARQWSIMEFARRSQLGYHAAYSLLLGGRRIGVEEAIGLVQALGRSVEYWLSLQREWEAQR